MKIICPACGYDRDGDREIELHDGVTRNSGRPCIGFYLLENVIVYRGVVGVKGDTIEVDRVYHTGEEYDGGIKGTRRLECRKCLCAFPLPAGAEVEFV